MSEAAERLDVGRWIKDALAEYADGGPDRTDECLRRGARLDWVVTAVEKAREQRLCRDREAASRSSKESRPGGRRDGGSYQDNVEKTPERYSAAQDVQESVQVNAGEAMSLAIDWVGQAGKAVSKAADMPAKLAEPSLIPDLDPEEADDFEGPSGEGDSLSRETPFKSAEKFRRAMYRVKIKGVEHWTLWCQFGEFFRWDEQRYQPIHEEVIRAQVYDWLDKSSEGEQREFNPDSTKVNRIIDALKAVALVPNEIRGQEIGWIGEECPLGDVRELIAMGNCILNMRTGRMAAPTPKFWTLNGLDFEYDPRAKCPRWLGFLEEVLPGDQEAKETVQEIFGYCATSETKFQKAFMLNGVKRSGKGTIARMLKGMVGEENIIGPTMAGFVGQFGMETWIGKKVAVFSDARMKGTSAVAVERLLSVTGEDLLEVARKYKRAWNGTLTTKVLILCNEPPSWEDDSGALPSRFIVLRFDVSFFGRENENLTDELLDERSGVFNWALEGWRRLVKRGRFRQPASGAEVARQMEIGASAIKMFVHEECELKEDGRVSKVLLRSKYEDWMREQRLKPISKGRFEIQLLSAFPNTIYPYRPGTEGERPRFYAGIKLKKNDASH